MKTLKEVACGQTVKVKKLSGGTGKETYHGHGNYQGRGRLCKKGCSAG